MPVRRPSRSMNSAPAKKATVRSTPNDDDAELANAASRKPLTLWSKSPVNHWTLK